MTPDGNFWQQLYRNKFFFLKIMIAKRVRLLKLLSSCLGNEINVKDFQDSQQLPDMFEYFFQIYQTLFSDDEIHH